MSDLDFAVLGPVEVRRGTRAVPLGGPKRRALLALLLVEDGRVVPVARIVDGLWGPTPPASARAQVQALVHGLRQVLRDAGVTDLIETSPPGYVIRAVGERCDLTAFTALLDGARAAAAAGRRAAAVDLFRDALALWRGEPLDGVDAPFAAPAVGRLQELRLAAIEQCVALELELGRHRAVVAELAGLVAEHPLREHLRGQLMLALYRCGRQVEALEVYRAGRESLLENLGLEPDAELRRLHQAILTEDGSLVATASESESEPAADSAPAADPAPPAPAADPAPPAPSADPAPQPAAPAPPARRRRRRRLAVAAAPVVTVLTALIVFAVQAQLSRRGAAAPPAQWISGPSWVQDPPQLVPSSFFGVTINSASGAMPTFRTGAVRLWDSRTRWANVEPRRGEFDWTIMDRLVEGAHRAGLPVLFVFGGTPGWASPNGPSTPYDDDSRAAPPDSLADWDAYVTAVARRYQGRIAGYELWNLANDPRYYSGSLATLVRMTEQASSIIKAVDPEAVRVCPSMGDLWRPQSLDVLSRFAAAGGYHTCDVAGVKLYQQESQDPPETMVALAGAIDAAFHRAGVHKSIWNTGTKYLLPLDQPLGRQDAVDYAVRFYLVALYVRYPRTFFYSWGSRKLPLVLQAEGGDPTEAALAVEELQRWLRGARIASCGHGGSSGLPGNVWTCRFSLDTTGSGLAADRETGSVLWTDRGTAVVRTEPGAYRLQRLDGSSQEISGAADVPVSGTPVLVRYRP